jgi:hypothetical protein
MANIIARVTTVGAGSAVAFIALAIAFDFATRALVIG